MTARVGDHSAQSAAPQQLCCCCRRQGDAPWERGKKSRRLLGLPSLPPSSQPPRALRRPASAAEDERAGAQARQGKAGAVEMKV